MIDTYTKHPIYKLKQGNTKNTEIYFLYWIADKRKINEGAWMVFGTLFIVFIRIFKMNCKNKCTIFTYFIYKNI